MPFARTPPAEPVTARDKRRIVAVIAAIVLVVAAVAVWAAVRPGAYGTSRDGCITVTIPSSTGGGLLHQCGQSAKSTCQRAFAASDKLSLLTRPQCRQAGIPPAP
ncbi:MAG TPA: hypothetical protein VGH96_06110 [Streptosporangiaceae bacterium]|jgi:hypothetical protein